MTAATIYDTATGEILYSCDLPNGAREDLLLPGQAVVEGDHDGETCFVDPGTGAVMDRTPFPVTLSDGLVAGVPAGTLAVVAAEAMAVDDGEIAIEGDLGLPQDVTVMLIHPRYIRETVTVSCPA